MIEEWREIPGTPYEASSAGEIRNAKTGKVLRQHLHKSGYMQVQIFPDRGKAKTCLVHRLVASAFISAQPPDRPEVAHNDGNRTNNAAKNLRWVTAKENMRDRDLHGTTAIETKNGKIRHGADAVKNCLTLRAEGKTAPQISAITGIPVGAVSGYLLANRRKHLTAVNDNEETDHVRAV